MLTIVLALIVFLIIVKTDALSLLGLLVMLAIAALPFIAWIGVRL